MIFNLGVQYIFAQSKLKLNAQRLFRLMRPT